MLRRLLLAAFFALLVCGLAFYALLFPALIYFRLSGPANPAHSAALQSTLRYILLPLCLALGLITFLCVFRRAKNFCRSAGLLK
jgi:hypothetical protein